MGNDVTTIKSGYQIMGQDQLFVEPGVRKSLDTVASNAPLY
jgi:hypothetical protein